MPPSCLCCARLAALLTSSVRTILQATSKHECIFCGVTGRLTREHFSPRWLRPYVGGLFDRTAHSVTLAGFPPTQGKLHRPGAPHTQSLRILCERCNHVRMGRLQERAKPYLLPLVQGDWSDLSRPKTSIIATWAVMTTMVIERAHPETAITSRDTRHAFATTLEIPSDWSVWIGRYSGSHSGAFNHVAWSDLPSPRGGISPPSMSQTTGFLVGNLFVLTLSAPWNVTSKHEFGHLFASQHGIVFLNHDDDRSPTVSIASLDDVGWNIVSRSISSSFGVPVRFSFPRQGLASAHRKLFYQ